MKQARVLKNYSQDYMAEALNISQKTYSNFENDRTVPNFSQIEHIASLLETSIFTSLNDEKNVYQYTITGGNNNNGFIQNTLPDKLLEQYELRIKKLEEENEYLKSVLNKIL